MMQKGMRVMLVLLLVIVMVHSFFHFFVLKSGVEGFAQRGVSGLALTQKNWLESFKVGDENPSSFSTGVLIVEWTAIFLFLFLMGARRKKLDKEELNALNVARSKIAKSWTKTDLDNLYEVLKERKNLKLSTISKAYNVDKDVVMAWGKALETANLIKIGYPLFGDPNFVYEEK